MGPSVSKAGRRRAGAGWLGVGMMSVLLAACSEENKYVAPPPPQVTVAAPLQQDVTRYLHFTGNTSSINTVDLVARVEGFLMSIDYKDGALMKKGDRLFLIQQDTYQADLDQAKAQLAAAEAQLTNNQAEYQRQATLGQQDFSSQATVDKARAARDEAAAQVDEAKANVEIATINLGYTSVTAPFDGIATRHLADVGQLVGHGQPTTLATLVEMNPIYAYFNIGENQVLMIKEKLAAEGRTIEQVKDIEIDIGLQNEGEDYPHKGRLDYVSPEIDPSTGTLLVRGVFDNPKLSLLPGLFVRVRIPAKTIPNAVLIADTAISTAQQGKYVLVVNKDNVVEQKIVTVGQQIGAYRVIESGLSADDRVVVGGIQRATPGSKVDPVEGKPDGSSTAAAAAAPAIAAPAATLAAPAAPAAAPAAKAAN